jgi:protein-S-isoprenylcysteine O-methyltransferase Ste14
MNSLFKTTNGMNLVGQGGKIIIFTLPFAAVAILLHFYYPVIVSLPAHWQPLRIIGYVLFIPGSVLWLAGLIQLLKDFPKGKLIRTGAYGICRNPIYSSIILFVLPAVSLSTLTWVYLVVALILYLSVRIFIRKEESKLEKVFGREYLEYKMNAGRIFPFIKPGRE